MKTDLPSNYSYSYEFFTEEPECEDIAMSLMEIWLLPQIIPINTDITAMISAYSEIDWFHFQPTTGGQKISRITLTDLPENYDLAYKFRADGAILEFR